MSKSIEKNDSTRGRLAFVKEIINNNVKSIEIEYINKDTETIDNSSISSNNLEEWKGLTDQYNKILIIGNNEESNDLISKLFESPLFDNKLKILYSPAFNNNIKKIDIFRYFINEIDIDNHIMLSQSPKPCSIILKDDLKIVSTKSFLKLILNNKHYCSDIIISAQYPIGIPPNIRANLDYIFIFKDINERNHERLYTLYGSMWKSIDVFKYVLTKYECIVIDNINGKTYYL